MKSRVLVRAGLVFVALAIVGVVAYILGELGPDTPVPRVETKAVTGSTTSAAEGIQAVAAVVQVLALIGGGIWASYVYLTSRKNRATLGIEAGSRIISYPDLGRVLFIRLRISNASYAVFHRYETTARLLAVRGWTADLGPILVPFAWQDPFLPVYGKASDNINDIAAGRLFSYRENQPIILEPGEGVETELVFNLQEKEPLLAIQVRVQGWERKPEGQKWIWSSFFYVDGATGTTTPYLATQEAAVRPDDKLEAL